MKHRPVATQARTAHAIGRGERHRSKRSGVLTDDGTLRRLPLFNAAPRHPAVTRGPGEERFEVSEVAGLGSGHERAHQVPMRLGVDAQTLRRLQVPLCAANELPGVRGADAAATGKGRAFSLVAYVTAVLPNGLRHYRDALDDARKACELDDSAFFGWAPTELIEAAIRSDDPTAQQRR